MKVCPLCKTKFDDTADFCPHCHAELEDLKEADKADKGKIPKSFWYAILGAFGFILALMLIYNAVYSAIL
ncbi:MAG: hypothetical protein RSA86_03385 [Christensenellaceae bacterium]